MLGSAVGRLDSSHQLVKQTPSSPQAMHTCTHALAGDLSILLPDFQYGE